MTYVTADLHGQYDLYCTLLEKIGFSENDTLYILGDLCDRGPGSAALYLDVMERKNVFCLMGNHEDMARQALVYLYRDPDYVGPIGFPLVSRWFENGGEATYHALFDPAVTEEQRQQILRFMNRLPLYREVEVKGRHYLLLHTASDLFSEDYPIGAYEERDLLWSRPRDFHATFRLKDQPEGVRLLVGHTPTIAFGERKPRIFYGKGNLINLDCGAAYSEFGGRLGCLCLETMKEEYVCSAL